MHQPINQRPRRIPYDGSTPSVAPQVLAYAELLAGWEEKRARGLVAGLDVTAALWAGGEANGRDEGVRRERLEACGWLEAF